MTSGALWDLLLVSHANLFFSSSTTLLLSCLQLLAMDVSAQVTMKDAAKCDKRCEWQNSANQEKAERILHFWVLLEVCLVQGVENIMPS